MVLTWQGTTAHPVTDGKRSTVVPVHRRLSWAWTTPEYDPDLTSNLQAEANLDTCATLRTGLFTPDYTATELDAGLADPTGDKRTYNETPTGDCPPA